MTSTNPDLQKAELRLREYCEERIPSHMRDYLQLALAKKENGFVLFEVRTPVDFVGENDDRPMETHSDVALFELDAPTSLWRLFWQDPSSVWHPYSQIAQPTEIEKLIDVMDHDPTGVFWG